jgi:hypothetical protein
MIRRLRFTNFKACRDSTHIRLAPLIVLFGANSAGKTSISQLLLLMKQTAASSDPQRGRGRFPRRRSASIAATAGRHASPGRGAGRHRARHVPSMSTGEGLLASRNQSVTAHAPEESTVRRRHRYRPWGVTRFRRGAVPHP